MCAPVSVSSDLPVVFLLPPPSVLSFFGLEMEVVHVQLYESVCMGIFECTIVNIAILLNGCVRNTDISLCSLVCLRMISIITFSFSSFWRSCCHWYCCSSNRLCLLALHWKQLGKKHYWKSTDGHIIMIERYSRGYHLCFSSFTILSFQQFF